MTFIWSKMGAFQKTRLWKQSKKAAHMKKQKRTKIDKIVQIQVTLNKIWQDLTVIDMIGQISTGFDNIQQNLSGFDSIQQDLTKKNFERKFFKKFLINLLNFYFLLIINTKNESYMKVWQSWHHPEHSGKQSKLLWADSTPPA